MEVLKHFDQETKKIVILKLKDTEWDNLASKLPIEYKKSYISEKALEKRIKAFGSTKEKELAEILPDKGNIKSGDFGEILSFFIIKERHKNSNVDGPRKWRWKEEKNVAAPYSDAILFSVNSADKPTKNDLLISVESKMKATVSKSYHPIENAINGAEKDYVSRIANSLSWLRKKYKQEAEKEDANVSNLKELVKIVERFINSVTVGEYTKRIKAIAIIDQDLFDDEIKKTIDAAKIKKYGITVFAVSVKDLKGLYEKVFTEIPKL
jgi:hypothetical protein